MSNKLVDWRISSDFNDLWGIVVVSVGEENNIIQSYTFLCNQNVVLWHKSFCIVKYMQKYSMNSSSKNSKNEETLFKFPIVGCDL